MSHETTFKSSTDGVTPAPNSILNSVNKDFYISHNNHDIDIYGSETTSLVIGQMEAFYILNGDHRSAYTQLMPQGLGSCMKYFVDNMSIMNAKSDTLARPVMS
tara:strand:+ start:222 stop:530 length:309 start_codon:yes stop_codon:yes gene_type:complete